MNTELYFSLIGAITGITGAVLGILGIFHNRFLATHQYLEAIEELPFIDARSRIYNSDPNHPIAIDNKDAALMVNFFHHWGLFTKKHYLPLWVFDYGSGAGVIRIYDLTKEYIQARREFNQDPKYGCGFEWLYHKLLTRRKKKGW